MTQEEKQLLLKDLCARLPYGVKIRIEYPFVEEKYWYPEDLCGLDLRRQVIADTSIRIEEFKPYLRPISSMTEEEKREVEDLSKRWIESTGIFIWPNEGNNVLRWNTIEVVLDWLNKHHFDYRGLIEKGLALEATEGMYK